MFWEESWKKIILVPHKVCLFATDGDGMLFILERTHGPKAI
jgi:hypothetical protein